MIFGFDFQRDEVSFSFLLSHPTALSCIGMLYQGLVLSTMKDDDAAQAILDVFSSFITDEISDFNSNVYYTNPDYLRCSYLEGKMLA